MKSVKLQKLCVIGSIVLSLQIGFALAATAQTSDDKMVYQQNDNSQQTATAKPETIYVKVSEPEHKPAGIKHTHERKGFFLGFNAGIGGGLVGYQTDDQCISDKARHGGFGALRAGYALSNSFAFSIEGFGFGSEENDKDWGFGASFVTATWWPDGGGVFIRTGFGSGGGEFTGRVDGIDIDVHNQSAAMFGIGYEWRLTEKFALGAAFDGFAIELDKRDDHKSDWAGSSGVSVQLNWYL